MYTLLVGTLKVVRVQACDKLVTNVTYICKSLSELKLEVCSLRWSYLKRCIRAYNLLLDLALSLTFAAAVTIFSAPTIRVMYADCGKVSPCACLPSKCGWRALYG